MRATLGLLAPLLACSGVGPGGAGSDITARVNVAPTPVVIDDRAFLIYDLFVGNVGDRDFAFSKVEVLGTGAGTVLASLSGQELDARSEAGPSMEFSNGARILEPGLGVDVIMSVPVDTALQLTAILHRIYVEFSSGETLVHEIEAVTLRTDSRVLLAPVRSGPWLTFAGPDLASHHRRPIDAHLGNLTNAQRYAYDFLLADSAGNIFSGSGTQNTDYYGYGAEVVAVAPGRVSWVDDGLPETTPQQLGQGFSGNMVQLDLGGGVYAIYAHLQPGVMVQVGENVSGGTVLGRIGNSGLTQIPHLHFHIENGTQPFSGEGRPYVFTTFEMLGRTRTNELPLSDELVGFP